MKIKILFLFLILSFSVQSQITLDKIIDKTKKKVVNRTEKKIDKTIDKGLDKTEEVIDNSVKKKEKKEKKEKKTKEENNQEVNKTSEVVQTPELNWSKYDFIPGTEIIFEDNLKNEKNGEFPSKWDLVQGTFENAHFDNENVIYCIKCNMNGGGGIVPLLKNPTEDYLPEEFTIEFDAYFEPSSNHYEIYFGDYKNQLKLDKKNKIQEKWIRISKNSVSGNKMETSYYPGFVSSQYDKSSKWRHVAISFNKRALKVYLDDARIINIPNLDYNPTGVSIGYQNVGGKAKGYMKNFRIAKGAVPLYDKLLTDGKIITNGIKFDINKAIIKQESMGVINEIVKIMKEQPDIKFSIEGHTDSDGDDVANQKLSEQRANSVLNKFVELGIDKSRLQSKGFGESKPMVGNDTPENKAQNRRVEFVKF